ncbi:MAG TPA: PqiC family protein [Candidatus Limnocylindrales bacterium]|nr:PqiC family protein [Candidatus Limnocylindrales bacterium]
MIRNKLAYSLLAFAAIGCSSATTQFYTLASLATPGPAPAAHYSILVGPVEIPPSVDRPQFVVQIAPNQIAIDELNCWAAPLGDGIARTVAGNLAVLLATHDVAVAPVANFRATHRVILNVQRFDSIPGKAVTVDALWTVTPTAVAGVARSGHTVAEESVSTPGYDALAAAHSRVLARLSSEIAEAIVASGKKKS